MLFVSEFNSLTNDDTDQSIDYFFVQRLFANTQRDSDSIIHLLERLYLLLAENRLICQNVPSNCQVSRQLVSILLSDPPPQIFSLSARVLAKWVALVPSDCTPFMDDAFIQSLQATFVNQQSHSLEIYRILRILFHNPEFHHHFLEQNGLFFLIEMIASPSVNSLGLNRWYKLFYSLLEYQIPDGDFIHTFLESTHQVFGTNLECDDQIYLDVLIRLLRQSFVARETLPNFFDTLLASTQIAAHSWPVHLLKIFGLMTNPNLNWQSMFAFATSAESSKIRGGFLKLMVKCSEKNIIFANQLGTPALISFLSECLDTGSLKMKRVATNAAEHLIPFFQDAVSHSSLIQSLLDFLDSDVDEIITLALVALSQSLIYLAPDELETIANTLDEYRADCTSDEIVGRISIILESIAELDPMTPDDNVSDSDYSL